MLGLARVLLDDLAQREDEVVDGSRRPKIGERSESQKTSRTDGGSPDGRWQAFMASDDASVQVASMAAACASFRSQDQAPNGVSGTP